MPGDNKERGSIHAGGGVTGNSWQLFKDLLSVSSFSLHLDFGLGWKAVEEDDVVVVAVAGGSGGVNQPPHLNL